jgi:prophage regulatory protein
MRARTFNEPAVSAAPDEVPSERASRAIELLREALSLLASNDAHTALHLATEDRLIKLPEVERLTGMKRSAIYELIQRGAFPKPVKVGARSSMWSYAAVQAWIAERLAEAAPRLNDARAQQSPNWRFLGHR